jgi:hypothetical protein
MEKYVIIVDYLLEGTRDTLRDATQFMNSQLNKYPYSEIILAKVLTSYGVEKRKQNEEE